MIDALLWFLLGADVVLLIVALYCIFENIFLSLRGGYADE